MLENGELHITNGSSAAGVVKAAFRLPTHAFCILHDVLSCGPLKKFSNINNWSGVRYEYWQSIVFYCDANQEYEGERERDLYEYYRDIDQAKEVHVWIGTSLSDQMMVAFLFMLLKHLKISSDKLVLHQYSRIDCLNFEIKGIGLVSPEILNKYVIVSKAATDLEAAYLQLWSAVTTPIADELWAYLSGEIANPVIRTAAAALIMRFPSLETGLCRFDEFILNAAKKHGPKASRVVGRALSDSFEYNDLTGDLYIYARLKAMADTKLRHPLLKLNRHDLPMRETEVSLTVWGEKILSGECKAVELNDLDDWVCGIHLKSVSETCWFRENKRLIEVPKAWS